jgi:hypothetical protein
MSCVHIQEKVYIVLKSSRFEPDFSTKVSVLRYIDFTQVKELPRIGCAQGIVGERYDQTQKVFIENKPCSDQYSLEFIERNREESLLFSGCPNASNVSTHLEK